MLTWLIVLVIGLPWLGALLIWLARDAREDVTHGLAVIFTALGGVASVGLLASATTEVQSLVQTPANAFYGDITFLPDGLACFLTAVASILGCLTVVYSVGYMRGEAQLRRYYGFVLVFIGAMCGLVLTNNLFLLVLFWELVALCSYALISFDNDNPKAVTGGIRALVITQIGGIGLLAGVFIVYTNLGTVQINALLNRAEAIPSAALSVLAFSFLAAAGAKSAQVPFHTWLPGAMEAPTPISALIHAATMVNAGVYVLARFYPVFSTIPGWANVVVIVGVVSALLAASLALVATDIKRVLAYSTISQLGYMVCAVGLGALFASQFHLLSHAVFKALLFLMAGTVTHAVGTRDMRDMGGLGRRMPFVSVVAWIGALGLMGVPILNGFWSKELILEASAETGFTWVFAALLLGAFLTVLYTLRLMWLVFYGEPRTVAHVSHPTPMSMNGVLAALALGTLVTWLLAGAFSHLLGMEEENLGNVVARVTTAPTTFIALGVMGLALALWLGRRAVFPFLEGANRLYAQVAASDWGFEWLNKRIGSAVQRAAKGIQFVQTGKLNWNIVELLIGLLVVLLVLGVAP